MAGYNRRQLNQTQIEAHLKSAVDRLTPDVWKKIDLGTPQMTREEALLALGAKNDGRSGGTGHIAAMKKRVRIIGTLAAACLCIIAVSSGVYTYQNRQVDSVIGIDVNPSVELSVNRKNRVLEAKPLNEDAEEIMEDMNLDGVELHVAVNAVIGSMVTHGFLDDLDNAILVTVSNDSISKATTLRTEVVSDIQDTLEENQVRAVVYDQQVIEEDDVKQLAENYSISYGKAYFLKELIEQNATLTMEDMDQLAPLTMEEIAREITERAYLVNGKTSVTDEMITVAQTTPSSAEKPHQEPITVTVPVLAGEETGSESSASASQPPSDTAGEETKKSGLFGSQSAPLPSEAVTSTQETTTAKEQEPVTEGKVKVDNADYENGVIYVSFNTKVKWKNPTVSVSDREGTMYSAMIGETNSYSCEIYVNGLAGGETYTFVIGGISPKIGKATTVKSTFDTPVIGNGNADDETTEPDEEETTEPTEEATSLPETETATQTPTETQTSTETEPATEPVPPVEETMEPEVSSTAMESGAESREEENPSDSTQVSLAGDV